MDRQEKDSAMDGVEHCDEVSMDYSELLASGVTRKQNQEQR